GAFAAMSAPIVPPAPGRFSTTTCWPSALVSWSAMTRAKMSVDWPGGKGTTILIGLAGQVCASTPDATDAAPTASSSRRRPSLTSGGLLVLLAWMLARDLEKVLQDLVAVLGGDAFGMELHAVDGQRRVAQAHDD